MTVSTRSQTRKSTDLNIQSCQTTGEKIGPGKKDQKNLETNISKTKKSENVNLKRELRHDQQNKKIKEATDINLKEKTILVQINQMSGDNELFSTSRFVLNNIHQNRYLIIYKLDNIYCSEIL